jgi:uncharacterized membrane protein
MNVTSFLKNLSKNHLSYLVMLGGLMGVYAAFNLIINKIGVYKNPKYIPSCSVNIWLDCGVVMRSKWSELFGFPNMLIGLMTYPMAFLTGLGMLLNPKMNKWFTYFCLLVSGLGVVMNIVLLYLSAYLISSLCPWCLLAGVATSNIFLSLLTWAIINDQVSLGFRLNSLIKSGWAFVPVFFYYFLMFILVYTSFFIRERGYSTAEYFDPIFWLTNKK